MGRPYKIFGRGAVPFRPDSLRLAVSEAVCSIGRGRMNPFFLYILAAAGLLFGACLFAAKRAFPQLEARQIAIIGVIALATTGCIWGLLSLTIGRHGAPVAPTNQPAPLRPDSDQP